MGRMFEIRAITEASSASDRLAAQALFRAYARFLRDVRCEGFHFERFEEEVAALPGPYTAECGEVLVAFGQAETGFRTPLGAIAYRQLLGTGEGAGEATDNNQTCEIKRLFVAEAGRGQGLGELLLTEVLGRARARGYRVAMLDTDPSSMQAAERLYRKLGFQETRTWPVPNTSASHVVYFRRELI